MEHGGIKIALYRVGDLNEDIVITVFYDELKLGSWTLCDQGESYWAFS